ncbi:hypothetical protein [Ruminiclostridium cellobioparum]|jgi:hypothetical protein|uniref:Uncharacterized protein n=2 Tax=Ruminiclostridium cellobioparum TaxID=29355 RepID=S0FSC4_RUMCE|nr:hypothetical protein [Ruminiclostridium cellobioparum]EMS73241.1 hypothetical protein CTER_0889 [Ruminiclostridium cellobioparum subsp. termitidis CT1112]
MKIDRVSKVYPVSRILKTDSLIHQKSQEKEKEDRDFEKALLLKKRDKASGTNKQSQKHESQ